LKLAVLFDESVRSGGGYQQALNAALLVKDLPASLVEPIYFSTVEDNRETLREYGIEAHRISLSVWKRMLVRLRRLIKYQPALLALQKLSELNAFERAFVQQGVDLVYFLSPNGMVNDLERLNYIMTVWDLCHRDTPEFPEVRADRSFEKRENLYRTALPKAFAILVDSSSGKINLVRRYGIDENRIHVIPFAPAQAVRSSRNDHDTSLVNVAKKYDLSVPYVYYPAQFWPHKNHVYLLQGLRLLEVQFGHRVGAVFSGGDVGNLAYVKRMVSELELSDRVRFAGFVTNEELPHLYRQSLALVMPTYFGPTNLPPLEAFSLGVPVLYSDRPGLREQVGDAALLMDLRDPSSMAGHLDALITQPDLREELVRKGMERLALHSDTERLGTLRGALEEFQRCRQCWD
jgi:glycosyltransferase involved in cell wall biosynthesis